MKGKDLKNMLVLLTLVFGAVAFGEQGMTPEEHLELNRQLKLLNKPAVKSFKTEFGDVMDCVNIFKQPAFSHPLLKNHTIQMKPSRVPTGLIGDTIEGERVLQHFVNIYKCPDGSVPIRRTRKEELIAANDFKPLLFNPIPSDVVDVDGYHFAAVNYEANLYGAKSRINIWNPSVENDQFSTANMWLAAGSGVQQTSILAGLGVVPKIYPNESRLNVYWSTDGYQRIGCYNQLCAGYVQISTKVLPGLPVKPDSTYNGQQYEFTVSVHQDFITGNWLFMYGDIYVGYWPKELLPGLSGGASLASWGGAVFSPISEASPVMGSGHFPEEGFGKAAFIRQMQVATEDSKSFVDPDDSKLVVLTNHPVCYGAIHKFMEDAAWRHHLYYGGPGECIFR